MAAVKPIGRYAFYRKESRIGCQIAFFIDQTPYATRRSMIENSFEFFTTRPLSKVELEEWEGNRECWNKRFVTWYYKDIEFLINEDAKYNVKTPQVFIDECRKRGYKRQQLQLEFEK